MNTLPNYPKPVGIVRTCRRLGAPFCRVVGVEAPGAPRVYRYPWRVTVEWLVTEPDDKAAYEAAGCPGSTWYAEAPIEVGCLVEPIDGYAVQMAHREARFPTLRSLEQALEKGLGWSGNADDVRALLAEIEAKYARGPS